MNKFIENISFKKVGIIYLILLVVCALGIGLFLGSKYFDKLDYLYNYHKISEDFENGAFSKEDLSRLTKKSKDIIDIALIRGDKVIYTVNNMYKNDLVRVGVSNYYKDERGKVYKLEDKKEFVLSLFSLDKDDYYERFNISNDYVITYLESGQDKIVFVNEISEVKNGLFYLKLSCTILLLFFMLYWIIVSLMVYQNALKVKLNAYFWGIITLFTNVIGLVIYLIYKSNRVTCPTCYKSNEKESIYCVNCGKKVNKTCKKCGAVISYKDKYCKSCGEKI